MPEPSYIAAVDAAAIDAVDLHGMRNNPPRRVTTFDLDSEVLDWVRAQAKLIGCSTSEAIRRCVYAACVAGHLPEVTLVQLPLVSAHQHQD